MGNKNWGLLNFKYFWGYALLIYLEVNSRPMLDPSLRIKNN